LSRKAYRSSDELRSSKRGAPLLPIFFVSMARKGLSPEGEGTAPPGVFFVRVANKGVKLDAASRLIDAGFRAAVFSVSCGGAAPFAKAMSERLAGKGLTGAVASDEWQLAGKGEGERERLVCPSSLKVSDESIK
jgi:hypothetical protein